MFFSLSLLPGYIPISNQNDTESTIKVCLDIHLTTSGYTRRGKNTKLLLNKLKLVGIKIIIKILSMMDQIRRPIIHHEGWNDLSLVDDILFF